MKCAMPVITSWVKNASDGLAYILRATYANGTTESMRTPLVNWNVRIFPDAFTALFNGLERQSIITFNSIIRRNAYMQVESLAKVPRFRHHYKERYDMNSTIKREFGSTANQGVHIF
ncbi:MAG: hypothetical protein ACLUGY_20060 [Phocaeicola massiliensis]